jgi:hypothetical protein
MERSVVEKILNDHVPEIAVAYCLGLWERHPFQLKLTKGRQTKVGDFTSCHASARPRITINNDLNQYLFLITYIHEVAHWYVYIKYKNTVDAHGSNWKNAFKYLLGPLLNEKVFPFELMTPLRSHMSNPKASSFADTALTKALRFFDKGGTLQLILSELPEGSLFVLHGRSFKKGKLRRTRFICVEMKTRNQYLVPADAIVSEAQLSLL